MGIAFYDKELISLTAQNSGLSETLVHENEQKVDGRLILDNPMQTAVFHLQSRVIRHIAVRESCVIVGRLSNFMLENRPNSLHLFIYADKAHRLKRIMSYTGADEETASALLKKADQERRDHCLHYVGCEWGDRHHYHLMFDSSLIQDEDIAAMIEGIINTLYYKKKNHNENFLFFECTLGGGNNFAFPQIGVL